MNKNLSFNFYLSYFLKGWKEICFPRGPVFVTFFVTSKCNARCEHCLYWQRLNKIKNELTLEEIEKISASMPPFPKLLLSGGEPFLRDDIDEICKVFYLNNKVKQLTIPTNGILSEVIFEKLNNILKFCKNTYIQLQLPIDGIEEIHDRVRNTPNAFNRMMETYDSVRNLENRYKNFEINFCFTFTSLNQDYIKDAYDYIVSKGSDSFSILLVRKPVKNDAILDFDFEKYTTWNRHIMQNFSCRNKSLSEIISLIRENHQMRIIENVVKNNKFRFRCTAGTLTAVIDEEGLVYPCEIQKVPFGSLRKENYDFKKIWGDKEADDFRKKLKRDKCRCTHESNTITNISFSPSFYFKLPIDYLRMRLHG